MWIRTRWLVCTEVFVVHFCPLVWYSTAAAADCSAVAPGNCEKSRAKLRVHFELLYIIFLLFYSAAVHTALIKFYQPCNRHVSLNETWHWRTSHGSTYVRSVYLLCVTEWLFLLALCIWSQP